MASGLQGAQGLRLVRDIGKNQRLYYNSGSRFIASKYAKHVSRDLMLIAAGTNPRNASLGTIDPCDIYSVAELSQGFKQILSRTPQFNDILLKGEISNFVAPTSGHIYFDLKDERNIIACAFFRHLQTEESIDLRNGLQVVAAGSLTIYEPKSQYQFNIKKIISIRDGISSLKAKQLRDKLERDGLFLQERKKPIPALPRKVGIITSKNSAAIKDILNVVGTRFPKMNLIMAYANIQGDGASGNIIQALRTLIEIKDVDVIVLARGGGSPEDFSAFNDEELVRVISSSTKPVITGIGHEGDVSLVDMAADFRASTPTNAAMAAVPDFQDLRNKMLSLKLGLERSYQSYLASLDIKEMEAQIREKEVELGKKDEAIKRGLERGMSDTKYKAVIVALIALLGLVILIFMLRG